MEKRIETLTKKQQIRYERKIRAKALHEGGYSISEIAKVLDVSEGTVRNLLEEQK
jgi:transposase